MSSSKKKYAVGIFLFTLLVLFIGFQYLFLKNIFGINPFARDILPKGFCKDCNVILISLDTLRAKSLPFYGNDKNTSPNLYDFANKSFLFKNTYSQSAFTLDSHFSIFTSLYPSSHKITIPFVSILNDNITTLTQTLQNSGYSTLFAAPLFDFALPLDKGLGRGFDHEIMAYDPTSWIDSLKKQNLTQNKFFAFLHTYWVHDPYLPDQEDVKKFYSGNENKFISGSDLCKKTLSTVYSAHPERFPGLSEKDSSISNYCDDMWQYVNKYIFGNSYEESTEFFNTRSDYYWLNFGGMDIKEKSTYIQAFYEARIYELDIELKKFFDYLESKDLLKNTVVILTADHGEAFAEHGTWTHGYNLYNEVIHVPLIIYVPNAKPRILDKLSESIDIAPSILYLLGIEPPKQFIGMNLFSSQQKQAVVSEHFGDRKYAILTKDWKLIINKDNQDGKVTKELYDLGKDYGETSNIINQHPEVASSLEKSLNSILSIQPVYEQKNNQPFPTWIDEKQRKKLIETGYF